MKKTKLLQLSALLILPIAVTVTIFAARSNLKEFENVILLEEQKKLLVMSGAAVANIQSSLNDISSELSRLSREPSIRESLSGNLTKTQLKQSGTEYFPLEVTFRHKVMIVGALYRINSKGIVLERVPGWGGNDEGEDFSRRPGVKMVLETRKPVISKGFKTSSGRYAISICTPVFYGEKGFVGIIRAVVYLDNLSSQISSTKTGQTGYTWGINDKGIVVCHPNRMYIGKNILAQKKLLFPDFDWTGLKNLIEKMRTGKSGGGTYDAVSKKGDETKVTEQITAFSPMRMINETWTIAVSVDSQEVTETIRIYAERIFVYVVCLIGIFLSIGVTLYILQQRQNRSDMIAETSKKIAEGLKERAERSEGIVRLIQELGPDMPSDEMLGVIVKASKSLVKADTASILLLDEKEDPPIIAASETVGFHDDGEILNPSLNGDTSITGWVVAHKEPLLLHGKAEGDQRFKNIRWKDGIKCSINVPLIYRGSVKGTMNLNVIHSDHVFTQDDLETVVTIANHSVVSLEHSGIFETLKKTSDEKVQKVSRKLEEAETQLIQAEKMAAVGQLASGVAHEINNPLSGVLGNIQIIKMEMKSGGKLDDVEDLLDIIEDAAKRCKSITQNLLDFSRIKKGIFEPFDAHKAIDQAVLLVEYNLKGANILVERKYSAEVTRVTGNKNEVQQVFLNMISNARWAIEQKGNAGGSITIDTRKVDEKFVEINFTDTGIGMTKETITKIFDPFYTTKEVGKGTGLGLSLCSEIMTKNKGSLTVDSEVGKGTTFHIKLPIIG